MPFTQSHAEERVRSRREPFLGIQRLWNAGVRWLQSPDLPESASERTGEAPIVVAMILGLTYFYLVPSPLLAMPGLIWFGLLAWKRLDIGLALMPLTFPFWYVPKRLFDNKVFPLSEIVLAVCVLLAVMQFALMSRQRLLSRSWLAWIGTSLGWWLRQLGVLIVGGTVLLLLGVSLGVLVARRQPDALRAWRWEIVEPLIYFVLLLLYGRSMRAIALLVWSFLGGALVVAVLAAVQVLWLHVTFTPLAQGNRLVPYAAATGAVPRATAFIYAGANSLGTGLARALPLALALALAAASRKVRAIAAVLAVVYLPALFWTNSRGAWVAAALACLFVLCVLSRRARWLVLGLVVLVGIVVVWQRSALVEALLLGHGGSGQVRLLLWLASWHMIRDHPWLGIGPDQFLYYYSPHYTSHPYWIPRLNGRTTPAAYQPDLSQPHNLILDLWLSGGLAALVGFSLLLIGMAQRFVRIWRNAPDGQIQSLPPAQASDRNSMPLGVTGMPVGALSLGIVGSVVAVLVQGMVDSAYFSPDLALAFWWAMALLLLIQLQVKPVED
ncbi:MAG: O-antigen ligase family protein [Ktedonobacterales bacterium]